MLQVIHAPPDRIISDIAARLLHVIDEENRLLSEKGALSLEGLVQRKSQLLLELMRAQKSISPVSAAGLEPLRKLKVALAANQKLLAMQVAAAQEITQTILEALRQGESDGTYGGGISAYYSPP